MTEPAPSPTPLINRAIVDSLDIDSRRLSRFTLFWYLKSLPDKSFSGILNVILVTIGAVLSLGLFFDWLLHRAFSEDQIDEALNYNLDTIDEQKIDEWMQDPRFLDWLSHLSVWAILIPFFTVLAVVIGWFVIRTLQWRRIRFGAVDGVIWMSGGLFATWTRRLPVVHVQSVEFRSTLLQRILRLRAVEISSGAPEGNRAAIELMAVNRKGAEQLADLFQKAYGVEFASPESDDADSVPVASVSWKQLIVSAANSFEFRLGLFSLYFLYQLFGHVGFMKEWRDRSIRFVTRYVEAHHDLANVVLVAIGAVVFLWVVSFLLYITTFAHFRLRRINQLALLEHGLLTRRWRTVVMPRIQALSLVESPLQQWAGDASLRMTLPGTKRNQIERTMLLPSLDRIETLAVLDRLYGHLSPGSSERLRQVDRTLERLPPSSRRPYVLRWTYRLLPLSLLLILLLSLSPWERSPLWGLLPWVVLGPVGAILGNIRFHDAGWRLDDAGFLIVRERNFSRTTRIARRQRIIWRRAVRIGLLRGKKGTFIASVAGAGSRPNLLGRLLGTGLKANSDSRFRVMAIPHDVALDLCDQLDPRSTFHGRD
jgi:putative membrane protein